MPYKFGRSGPKSDDDGRPFRGDFKEWMRTEKKYNYRTHESKYKRRR